MRKSYLLTGLLAFVLIVFNSCSSDDDGPTRKLVTLDLSTFDLSDGIATADGVYWSGTYNNDAKYLDSQIFRFGHTSQSDLYKYWFGFTVSNSKDNSKQEDFVANQFSCMAKGGNAGESAPYLVSCINLGKNEIPTEGEVFDKDKYNWVEIIDEVNQYKATGAYVCNSSWAYYSILEGDAYARKFAQGDYFVLKAYGVGIDNIIKTTPAEFYLADYRSENEKMWTLNTEWEWMDLSALGEVKYIIFRMESTDKGEYGINTPTYFCLDQLVIEKIN